MTRTLVAYVLMLLGSAVHAQSVALAGMLGNKALLVVNGTAPKTVAAGETHEGVKVVSTRGDQAVVEQDGKMSTRAWANRLSTWAPAKVAARATALC